LILLHNKKHQWSSGRIVPCHGTDPGSIPGWCKIKFLRINFMVNLKSGIIIWTKSYKFCPWPRVEGNNRKHEDQNFSNENDWSRFPMILKFVFSSNILHHFWIVLDGKVV
jgi:hypothetical protein